MNSNLIQIRLIALGAIFTMGSLLTANANQPISPMLSSDSKNGEVNEILPDEEPPQITAPSDMVVDLSEGLCTANISDLGTPQTSDNVGVVDVYNDAPAEFPLGSTEVTWTAVDAEGNESTAVQGIKVMDKIAPEVMQPEAVIFSSDNDACHASGKVLAEPTATDNCSIASFTHDAPVVFPLGETTVNWIFEDQAGNQTKVEQLVIVEDRVHPQINAPENIKREADSQLCGIEEVQLGAPEVFDNCSIEAVINDAPDFFPLGQTIVTWTVIDAAGNQRSASQAVLVEDEKAPIPEVDELPAIQVDCSVSIEDFPTALDNCSQEIVATTESQVEFEEQGTYEIIWNYEDEFGNRSEQVQQVIVDDNSAPEVMSMPENMEACEGTIVAYAFPEADDCSGVSIERKSGFASGTIFPVGVTQVSFKFTDGFQNEQEQGFTVTVHPRPEFEVSTTLASCSMADGNAELDIAEAAEPFTLDWEENDPQALAAGEYQVTLEDANGCRVSREFEILNPENPTAEVTTTPVTCFGVPNGTAEISVAGGTPEYTIDWAGADPEQLENGDYTVIVVDAANCRTTESFTIQEPEEILIDGEVTNAQGGMANGAIDISIIGGVPGFAYSWDNGEQTEDLTGLAPGEYNITVTDENDCSKTKLYVVDNATGVHENSNGEFNLFPNPTSGEVNINLSGVSKSATLRIIDLTGKVIKLIDLSKVENSGFAIDLSDLAEGIYLLKLTDGEQSTVKRIVKRNK
jgi:hypothetical protein